MRNLLAPILAVVSGCAIRGVPTPMQELEERSRSAYEAALGAQWDAAALDAAHIDRLWTQLRPFAETDGASPGALLSMDEAVSTLEATSLRPPSATGLARTANAVGGALDDLFALYEAPELARVVELDALARELILDALAGDFDSAELDAAAVERAWLGIRPEVVVADAEEVALTFDATVDQLRTLVAAGEADDVARAAGSLRVQLDQVRRLFPVKYADPVRSPWARWLGLRGAPPPST